MNVAEMVDNVNAECHPITDIDRIIIRWLNRGQKVVASKGPSGGWLWLRQYGHTLSTVDGVEDVALSPLVDTSKVISIRNQDIPKPIYFMTEQEFRYYEPGPTATGDSFVARFKGLSPVQNQPSAASVLTLVSSSVADTAVVVNVQGLDGSGVLVNETVTMNGAVSVSTTNSYTRIMSLSKGSNSVGTITITSNAGVVTNVRIAPKDRHVSHPILGLYNIPGSVATLYYDFTMKLPDITDLNDISLIPEQYHDTIELYAKMMCFKHLNNPQMATLTLQQFEGRIQDMKTDFKQPSGPWSLNSYSPHGDLGEPQLPSNFPRQYT